MASDFSYLRFPGTVVRTMAFTPWVLVRGPQLIQPSQGEHESANQFFRLSFSLKPLCFLRFSASGIQWLHQKHFVDCGEEQIDMKFASQKLMKTNHVNLPKRSKRALVVTPSSSMSTPVTGGCLCPTCMIFKCA